MNDKIELLKQARAGSKQARDRLVEENVGLVWRIVRRYGQRGYDYDDLFQIGCIGLLKAIDRFDYDQFDVQFGTYACPMINGEIRRFLRDDGMVKISRTIKENAVKIRRAKEQFVMENDKEPNIQELSVFTGLSCEDILTAVETNFEVESLHKQLYMGDHHEITLIDKIEETTNENEKIFNKILIKELISKLKDRERKVIILRFFQNQTQSEIAKLLGISQVQVSRLEKRILSELKILLEN